MRKIITKILLLVFMLFYISSCATTSLVDSWRNPGISATRPHKLLVKGNFKNTNNRRVYEDILANELTQRGIEAIPAHTLGSEKPDKGQPSLDNMLKVSGAEAILTLQTVKVEHQELVQPGITTIYPDYWNPPAFPFWDLDSYYGPKIYYEPARVSTYDTANIQVSLFDAKSRKLLWAATIKTIEPGNVVSVSKDMAEIVVSALIKEGFI
ncbi:MAG: DUF4136 domain-containing protein [Desulfuromonadaceae bacterium]|nr:DUF4136 domain-containing protein [Desulfuromonadaceae bacterium]